MSSIQIPMIFDVTAEGTIYGESIAKDVITAHLKFNLNRNGHASSTSFINAMKKILYADEKDADASGVYFYKDDTTTTAKAAIGDAIKALLFGSSSTDVSAKITHAGKDIGNTNEKLLANFGYAAPTGTAEITTDTGVQAQYAGIPLGKNQISLSTWSGTTNNEPYYQNDFIDSTGATISTVLIRVAATHLMGHPFAQGFIQENSISTDLYNTDFATQIENSFLSYDSNILKQATKGSTVDHTDGVKVPILQTIYEQLIQVNPAEHRLPDDIQDDDDNSIAQELIFKPQNTVTFYIRPRLFLKLDQVQGITSVTGTSGSENSALGTTLAASGIEYNPATGVSSSPEDTFAKIFTSGNGDAEGYYWLTVKNHHGLEKTSGSTYENEVKVRGSDNDLSQWTTNYTWAGANGVGSSAPTSADGTFVAMFDAHIWKITVTL